MSHWRWSHCGASAMDRALRMVILFLISLPTTVLRFSFCTWCRLSPAATAAADSEGSQPNERNENDLCKAHAGGSRLGSGGPTLCCARHADVQLRGLQSRVVTESFVSGARSWRAVNNRTEVRTTRSTVGSPPVVRSPGHFSLLHLPFLLSRRRRRRAARGAR